MTLAMLILVWHAFLLQGASKAGEDIRQAGSDIKTGQAVLQAGALLGPPEIGLLATVGAVHVKVRSHALWQTSYLKQVQHVVILCLDSCLATL